MHGLEAHAIELELEPLHQLPDLISAAISASCDHPAYQVKRILANILRIRLWHAGVTP